jgi:site-specific recombinase XerD
MDKPKLLEQVRTTAALRYLSPRTCEAYTHWIKRFILFNNKKHPLQMGAPEVHLFLSYLAQVLKVSASTQNQALNAIAFLYHQVLGHKLGATETFPRAKRPKHLPVVFAPAEVQKVLGNLTGTDHLMASLLYGSGLRLTECTSLRVKDLDFDRHLILVRRGKGEKDRVTMLPRTSLSSLHRQVETVREIHRQDLSAKYAGATLHRAEHRARTPTPLTSRDAWSPLFVGR